jgi:TusA-related sulfurtransferase
METSGITGNRVLLRLRKVTATRQLQADRSLTVKATKPRIQGDIQEWNKEELGQKRK